MAARSYPTRSDLGAASQMVVASQLEKTLLGSWTGPTTVPGIASRFKEEALKNASVSAATRSASAWVKGVGPQVAST